MSPEDYLPAVRTQSDRLRAVLAGVDPEAPVPTCPGWSATDLAWHLTEVQDFWARVVEQRAGDPEGLTGAEARPAEGMAAQLDALGRATDRLLAALTAAAPDSPAWTWFAPDQTAGFVRRRQAHEALIHRVDAECLAGDRTPLPPALASDGVDEALRVMFDGAPEGMRLDVADPAARVRVHAVDTGARWQLVLARFSGSTPAGTSYDDEPTLVVRELDDQPVAATVEGTAADLDCWLWNRPPLRRVVTAGDPEVLAGLRAVIDSGIS